MNSTFSSFPLEIMYDFSAAACVCRDERIAFATFQRCQRPKSFYGNPMVSSFYDTKSDIGLAGACWAV
jgi:hypothetical protein